MSRLIYCQFVVHCVRKITSRYIICTLDQVFNSNLFMASLRVAIGINYFNDKIRPNGNSILVYLIMVINVGTPNFVHLYYLARKKSF